MNKLLLFFTATFLSCSAFGHAQIPEIISPPQSPFVSTPKPGTSWQITITYQEPSSPPTGKQPPTPSPRRPVSIVSHCGLEATHTVLTWSDGTKSEAYITGSVYVLKNTSSGKIYSLPVQDQDHYLPVFTKGYQGVSWLLASYFQHVEELEKQKAYKYANQISRPQNDGGAENANVALVAWIGVKDGIPLRTSIGEMLFQYGPITEANPRVEIPPDIKAYLAEASKEQQALDFMKAAHSSPK